jgi:hypothetical protein
MKTCFNQGEHTDLGDHPIPTATRAIRAGTIAGYKPTTNILTYFKEINKKREKQRATDL